MPASPRPEARAHARGRLAAGAPSKGAASPGGNGRAETPMLEFVSLLANDVLLIVSRRDARARRIDASLDGGGREPLPLETRSFRSVAAVSPAIAVATIHLPEPLVGESRGRTLQLRLRGERHSMALTGADELTDVRTVVRRRFAPLDAATRGELLGFLAGSAAASGGTADPGGLSERLYLIREALRERLPLAAVSKDEPIGLHVDALLAVDDHSFYVRGWVRDSSGPLRELTAVSPEGVRVALLDRIVWRPRPDVESFYEDPPGRARLGFTASFSCEAPSRRAAGWILEVFSSTGAVREAAAPSVVRDPIAVRTALLADLSRERDADSPVMDHVVPAITRIQERLLAGVRVDDVVQFGAAPVAPETSIVVPLYKRVDFLEHQLAHFAHDPEVRSADLVYVLDSPEIAPSLLDLAAQLGELYGVPFRVATSTRNGGFAAANNLGASLARGRLLVLLNSDVVPDQAGWLGRMAAFYDSTAEIGALGPKLLFEDDSIQHAGLYFYRTPGTRAWENLHSYKGHHRRLAEANVRRPVPAVTAACLMIDRELYRDMGGLHGAYVQGDYEDSDLCLRLIEAGRKNWYLPDVELYHLEGQSYGAEARAQTSRYNKWLHTRLWDERIERMTVERGSG